MNACKCDNTNASLTQDEYPVCFTSASQGGLTFTSFSVTVKLIPSETVASLSVALPFVTDLITVIVWTRIGRWEKKIPGKVKISCHVGKAHSLKAEGRRRGLKLTGTLRNYDDDDDDDDEDNDNDNAKKTIGFMSKTTALQVHWRPLHDYDVKPPNATFCGGRGRTTTNFPFSIWTWIKP